MEVLKDALKRATLNVKKRLDVARCSYPTSCINDSMKCVLISTALNASFNTGGLYDEDACYLHLLSTYPARPNFLDSRRKGIDNTKRARAEYSDDNNEPIEPLASYC